MYSSQPNTYEKYSNGQPVSSDSAATGVPYDPSLSQPNTYDKYSNGQPVSSDSAATGVPYDPSLSQPSAFSIDKPKPRVPWTTGLFDCFSDMKTCCITCWCPCITFGQIAEIVDKGGSSCGASGALYTLACVIGCPCFYSCFYRSKMRQHYMLEESFCGDCMIHWLCEGCALCQEHRELQNRGYDMSIGWHGNVERRNKEAMTGRPVVEGGMSR